MTENAASSAPKAAKPGAQPEPTAGTKREEHSALREWTKSIVFAVVAWLILRTFLVEAFRIPSPSMENTLLVGDFLFVNKAIIRSRDPVTGHPAPAFRERGGTTSSSSIRWRRTWTSVKRAVGVAGDTLEMRGGSSSGTVSPG